MRSEVRLLPHLNSLYDQKKSYEVHRKKISSIKKSLTASKKNIKLKQNSESTKSETFSVTKNLEQKRMQFQFSKMQTIQQVKDISYWMKRMSPFEKRLKLQQINQNKRLRQKIKNSVSWVSKFNRIQQHGEKFTVIKNRLLKFHTDSGSQLMSLKCDTVLKRITAIQKQKMKLQESRIKQLVNKSTNQIFVNHQDRNHKSTVNNVNNRYLRSNKTEMFKRKDRQERMMKNLSSRSSMLLNVDQKQRMPQITQQRRLKTQIVNNEKQILLLREKSVERVKIDQSKLSKLSMNSYLSQKIQKRQNIKLITQQPQTNNSSQISLKMIRNTQKMQRSKSLINKKPQSSSRKSQSRRTYLQRKKIQRYYSYKNSFLFKIKKSNQEQRQNQNQFVKKSLSNLSVNNVVLQRDKNSKQNQVTTENSLYFATQINN